MNNLYIKVNDSLKKVDTGNQLAIGIVTTLPPNSNATVTAEVVDDKTLLNFGIPKGVSASKSKTTTFSTEEQVVGTWTNGKPVYSRTYSIDNPKDGQIIDTIPGIELVTCYGTFTISSAVYTFPTAIGNSTSTGYRCLLYIIEDSIYVNIAKWTVLRIDTTIEYVKTTDVETVPSTDYSFEEKVVGTWVDNRPVYQKVIQETGKTQSILLVAGADNLVYGIGQWTHSNGNTMAIPWGQNSGYVLFSTNQNNIYLMQSYGSNFLKYQVIIQYTKVSDLPEAIFIIKIFHLKQ